MIFVHPIASNLFVIINDREMREILTLNKLDVLLFELGQQMIS